jgi:hypothetical protein
MIIPILLNRLSNTPKTTPLRPKQFFHFPELLLLITIVALPIIVGNSTINILTSDTIFVFGGNNLYNDSFSAYVDTILLFSWLSHIVLRKYSLMHKFLRWVQVILSIIAILTLTIVSLWLYPDSHNIRPSPPDYSRIHTYMDYYQLLSWLVPWSAIIFILLQLIFWTATAILLFRKSN